MGRLSLMLSLLECRSSILPITAMRIAANISRP